MGPAGPLYLRAGAEGPIALGLVNKNNLRLFVFTQQGPKAPVLYTPSIRGQWPLIPYP